MNENDDLHLTLRQNMRKQINLRGRGEIARLAEALGVRQDFMSRMLSVRTARPFPLERARQIAEIWGIEYEELTTPSDMYSPDEVSTPRTHKRTHSQFGGLESATATIVEALVTERYPEKDGIEIVSGTRTDFEAQRNGDAILLINIFTNSSAPDAPDERNRLSLVTEMLKNGVEEGLLVHFSEQVEGLRHVIEPAQWWWYHLGEDHVIAEK